MIVYYNRCETCKESPIKRVRAIAKQYECDLDERYIYALSQWAEEAKTIGATLPFMFSPTLKQHLEISDPKEQKDVIIAFLQAEQEKNAD